MRKGPWPKAIMGDGASQGKRKARGIEPLFVMAGIEGYERWTTESGEERISFSGPDGDHILLTGDGKGDVSGYSSICGTDTVVRSMHMAEQEVMRFAHEIGRGPGRWRDRKGYRYLSLTDMANMLGVRTVVLANHPLPFPDVYIGDRRGWTEETFERWRKRHPDLGRGTRVKPPESQGRGPKGKRRYEW